MLKELTPIITILLCIYCVADIIIPAFTKGNYFWFIKSFKRKTGFEKELADAEKAFNEAFQTLKNISESNTAEYEKAKEMFEKAKDLHQKARDVYEQMKNNNQ